MAGHQGHKSPFKGRPYSLKNRHGYFVHFRQRAAALADYLRFEQWGAQASELDLAGAIPTTNLARFTPTFDASPPTFEEVDGICRGLKTSQAPGPDGLAPEIFKMLPENAMHLLTQKNQNGGRRQPSLLKPTAPRLPKYTKKGPPEDPANYRPISLLNPPDKIMAAILKRRIEQGTEAHLQRTQYGFRKAEARPKLYIASDASWIRQKEAGHRSG